MLKIYGANLSSPANKVRMTANLLGLSYEYIPVNLREGKNRAADFLKLNPAGKVPVIDDDGFVLFESNAIVKYLAVKAGSSLYPKNLKAQALVDQWTDFATIHIGTAMGRVLFNKVFAPIIKAPVDEQSLNDGIKFLGRFLPVADTQLAQQSYLAGPEMTLADIALLTNLDPAEAGGVDVASYDHLRRWREGLMRQEFYTKCHISYEDALKKMMAGAA